MPDLIQKLGASLIQHGKHNDRIYLMKLERQDYPAIIARIETLVLANNYSKIFAKVPISHSAEFLNNGYQVEASIPDFYHGKVQALFLAKYFAKSRSKLPVREIEDFKKLVKATPVRNEFTVAPEFCLAKMTEHDTEKMAELYRTVFQSYPFPIDNSNYLSETMKGQTVYFGVRERALDRLIALSSAEVDLEALNVEMTDFAVLPEYRGRQLALLLLREMEQAMRPVGIKTAYTIARLKSTGMNVTFLKSGYRYTGTLVNNTNISGGLESMNVLYKKLTEVT
jgi:putative beta-lysine N-acetyltransferase